MIEIQVTKLNFFRSENRKIAHRTPNSISIHFEINRNKSNWIGSIYKSNGNIFLKHNLWFSTLSNWAAHFNWKGIWFQKRRLVVQNGRSNNNSNNNNNNTKSTLHSHRPTPIKVFNACVSWCNVDMCVCVCFVLISVELHYFSLFLRFVLLSVDRRAESSHLCDCFSLVQYTTIRTKHKHTTTRSIHTMHRRLLQKHFCCLFIFQWFKP